MTGTPPNRKQKRGRLGESAALAELKRLGYRVVARNYHCRGGEADLVAEDGDDLVFIEVKARSDLRHGLPREAVGWTKQQRLGCAARAYCCEHGIEDRPIRFDVVEIALLRDQVAGIQVITHAFVPDEE